MVGTEEVQYSGDDVLCVRDDAAVAGVGHNAQFGMGNPFDCRLGLRWPE